MSLVPVLMSTRLRTLRQVALAVLAGASCAFALAGCGGGGGMATTTTMTGPQACTASTCNSAMITLTDADGPFNSYTVDVTSLQLTKADHTMVETLPVKTRVDFTQLVNLAEFLTAATVPNGEYVAATMTVDYSNAAVFVDVGGMPQQANLVDSTGAMLKSTLQLTVQLDAAHHLMIAPGTPARLALDFNLAASNSVDLTPTPAVVTVKPFMVASVVPIDTKELRVRGTLVSVDVMNSRYVVNVEPFEDQDANRGTVTVDTTTSTTFEINGTDYTGTMGLMTLNGLPAGTWTVAFGALDPTKQTFTATRVLAASSLLMPGDARVTGTVIARVNGAMAGVDTLTVRGARFLPPGGVAVLYMPLDVTLTIGNGTAVTEADNPATPPTIANISIGSAITAFGVAGTNISGTTLDATAGRVRLEYTTIEGAVVSSGTGLVTLNLQTIDGWSASAFNFAGTGTMNSNPAMYQVATGTQVAVTGVAPGTLIAVIGFVQPFGAAQPDFEARTWINFAPISAVLDANFVAAVPAPFMPLTSTGMVLNLNSPPLGPVHYIRIGAEIIDLTKLTASPQIVPDPTGPDAFVISTALPTIAAPGAITVFGSYGAFETALATELTVGTTRVLAVDADGAYDAPSNTFIARRIIVELVH